MTYRTKAASSVFLVLLDRGGQQAVHFIVTVLLARILVPEDFGLIAIVGIVVAISQIFVDGGFGQALIQKQSTTSAEESSVFFFNLILGSAGAAAIFLLAPAISTFFDDRRLQPLLEVSSVILVVNSLSMVQIALLTQSLNFKKQLKVSFASVLVSGLVAVLLAYHDWGVWSLVGQQVSLSVCRVILLWALHPWRPHLEFSVRHLRGLFGFGSRILASSALDVMFQHIHLVAIGKIFSLAEVGYYSRAQGLQGLVARDVSASVGKVAFPMFSAIRGDAPKLRVAILRAASITTYINFPLMFGLAVAAEPIVSLLLTEKWLPIVPYLQVFCVVGMFNPIQTINHSTLKALGKSDLYLLVTATRKVLTILALALTYRWGVIMILLGQLFVTAFDACLSSHLVSKQVGSTIRQLTLSVAPGFFISCGMACCVYLVGSFGTDSAWIRLASMVLAGSVTFVLLSLAANAQAFRDLLNILRDFSSRKNAKSGS
jgi:teichuronic acid exporter